MTPKDLPELTDTEITVAAMSAGFMLSTAHGQSTNKLMPVSDRATLIAFARAIQHAAYELGARSTAVQPAGCADEAAGQIEHLDRENHRLAREAWTWSKACEAATRKLHILSTHHPRLEVRYWTGSYWEPMYGAALDRLLETLEPAAPAAAQPVEQIPPLTRWYMNDNHTFVKLPNANDEAILKVMEAFDVMPYGMLCATYPDKTPNPPPKPVHAGAREQRDEFYAKAVIWLDANPHLSAASGDSTPPSAPVQGDSTERSGYRPEAVDPGSLSLDDVAYPRDLFDELIHRGSPYAFYLFQWVPYQTDARRWRLKMLHDVRTFDGREALGIWPNGSHCGPFRDDEVEFIRISRKQHCGEWIDPRKVPEPPQGASGERGD